MLYEFPPSKELSTQCAFLGKRLSRPPQGLLCKYCRWQGLAEGGLEELCQLGSLVRSLSCRTKPQWPAPQGTILNPNSCQVCIQSRSQRDFSTSCCADFLSYLPPHPLPLGCTRAPALGALHHASNSHRSSILHMVIYMLLSYSLKSSHSRLLTLSPKLCSLCLCLLRCPACRIIGTIFLNPIYMQ